MFQIFETDMEKGRRFLQKKSHDIIERSKSRDEQLINDKMYFFFYHLKIDNKINFFLKNILWIHFFILYNGFGK